MLTVGQRRDTPMRRLLLALALGLALGAATGPAALAVEREHGVYRGQSVRAAFVSTDACLLTRVDVFGLASTIQWLSGTPYRDANLWVSVTQVDTCTGQQVLWAPGYASTTGISIAPSLSAATVRASLDVYNWNTSSWMPVTLDLSWAATGDRAREGVRDAEHGDRYVAFYHYAGTTQPATAAGSVSFGGANLAATATRDAEIVSTREGELFVAPHNDPD